MIRRALPALTVVIFVVLATAVSLIVPTFEFLDERDHYAYIQYLFLKRALPPVSTSADDYQQYYQPPLYHTVAALAALPISAELEQPVAFEPNVFFTAVYDRRDNDNKNLWLHTNDDVFPFRGTARAVHVARIASVLFGAANALALLGLGREIFGESEWAAALVALALLLPGYVSISGALSNDNAAAFGGTLVLLFCWRLTKNPDRRCDWIALAISISIATLSKITTLFMAPAIALTMLIAWKGSRDRRALLINFAALIAIWIAATGWWFWRNVTLYGEPTAVSVSRRQLGQGGEFSAARLWMSIPFIWQTFLGRFANSTVPMPFVIYNIFAFIILLAAAGWVRRAFSPKPSRNDGIASWLVVALASACVTGAVLYHAATNNTGAAGRLLYPALAGFAALTVGGLSRLVPARYHRTMSIAICGGMAALSTAAVYWSAQAVALPAQFDDFQPPQNFRALDFRYGDSITLRGYTLSTQRTNPGRTLAVTLYWETDKPLLADYVVFLQLVDERDNKIAQRDTFSGGGLFPTTRWTPNRVVADTVYLTVDPNAPTPQAFNLIGGFWNLSTGERLPIRSDNPAAQIYKLGEVVIAPENTAAQLPPSAHELAAKFASGIQLRGCVVSAGGSQLALYWLATESVNKDYTVYVHLLGDAGNLIAGLDHLPMRGRFPARHWRAGDWIEDSFAMPDTDAVARVDVGLYASDTLERLPLIEPPQPDGVFSLPAECWKP